MGNKKRRMNAEEMWKELKATHWTTKAILLVFFLSGSWALIVALFLLWYFQVEVEE